MTKFRIFANIVLFAALFVIFFSCGKDKGNETTDKNIKKEDPGTDTVKKMLTLQKENQLTEASRIDSISYDVSKLDKDIKYEGTIVGGARWIDKTGKNILLITETKTEEYPSGMGDDIKYKKKELNSYQFLKVGNEYKLLWKINDFVKDCPLDVKLSILPNSITISDINNNGIAESTFLYQMACRGDVGVCNMKLIMHEGNTKYAIRGTRKQIVMQKVMGGETNIDKSFDTAPAGFVDYAKGQWEKFIVQRLGE